MSVPLVSVIVACYNHQKYIEECLLSIFKQSYDNIEIIVIDDGSKDNSSYIVERLRREYDFYYESQNNMGFSRTLNKAIGIARGKYVSYIGSDDIMESDKTKIQVDFLEKRPEISVCGGNVISIDSQGRELPNQKFPPYRELGFEDIFLGLKPGIVAPTVMFRRETLLKEGGYDPDIPLEDMYMWLKLTSRGYIIAGLDKVLLRYRKHSANTYKNYEYMVAAMLKTYSAYTWHDQYHAVVNRMLVSYFLAAAKHDRTAAMKIFKMIQPRYYSLKVLRGLFHALSRQPIHYLLTNNRDK